jgi:hypothetical protein
MRRALPLVSLLVLLSSALPIAGAQAPSRWVDEVALAYREWGRVDDELRWAPWLCRLPLPSAARVSRAERGHDRKVYFVYASDRDQYLTIVGTNARPRPGLTVVKESFHPRPIASDAAPRAWTGEPTDPHFGFQYRPAPTENGGYVGPGEPGGLYVMRYVGPRAGTDDGWVYGTRTADGQVTGDGVIETCVGCHRSAPHGRLFGLAR